MILSMYVIKGNMLLKIHNDTAIFLGCVMIQNQNVFYYYLFKIF